MKPDIISRMRHQITFQSESLTTDSGGGYSLSWSNGSTVWAEILPSSGSERFFAGQMVAAKTFRITTRYISGITSKMRILYGSRVLNIRSISNLEEKNEWLEIIAEEGVTQ